jgi:hypothetical protein
MSDTTETTQTTPAPEGEPQGKGGMMSFDAAASIADAFAKLKDGDAAPDAPIETEPTGPTNHSGDKGPEGEAGKPESEEKEIKVPTSDDLAKLRGKKAPAKKKEETHEPSEDRGLENASESAKNAFAAMRKDLKAEREKAAALEARLAELEKSKSETDPEEVQRLRSQNEEYERELQVARVEATKEFKDAVVAPMQAIRESISQIASKYEIVEADIVNAFAESDASARADKLSDIAAGMNDRDKFALYDLETRFAKVQSTRQKVVNNAKLALEKIEQHREEQSKLQKEEYGKRYNGVVDKVIEEGRQAVPLLRPIDGDDEWNGQLAGAEKFVRELDFEGLNEDSRARVAYRSAVAPIIYGQFVSLYNRYQELEKSLEKYQKATPKAGGGGSAPAAPAKEEFDDFMSALKANLR